MNWWDRFSGRGERRLRQEIEFHADQRAADLVKAGLSEQEARRKVRHEFGGIDQVVEHCHEAAPGRWADRLLADIRYSLRGMRNRPAATVTAVLTIAVCVSVNTAIYSVVDSLLIRPLPFHRPDRLIAVTNKYPKAGIVDQEESAPGDYIDREGTIPAIAGQALYSFVTFPIDRGGNVLQARGMTATPSLFALLGVQAARGRLFSKSEGEAGGDDVVVLTGGFQRELFARGDTLGQQLRIDGRLHRVIGVLPASFRFVDPELRYVLPMALTAEQKQQRHNNNVRYIARLRDGATVAEAQTQINALSLRLLDKSPQFKKLILESGFHSPVAEFQPWLMRRVRPSLRFLWAGALLVLIAGAANLAGLALARAHAQIPELATRAALGATRADVVRRALVDGVIPALLGALLGIAGGAFAVRNIPSELLPGASGISLSPSAVLYAITAALFAGAFAALISLIPLRAIGLGHGVQTGFRSGTRKGARLRKAFVLVQTALAFVLLYGASILSASIRELSRVDPGFRVEGIWTASSYLPTAAYPRSPDRRAAMERIVQGIREIPGVDHVGGSSDLPLAGRYDDNVIAAEGYSMQPGESVISPVRLAVTPGYLESLHLLPAKGRLFDGRDTSESPGVVIVDERLAQRFWPSQDPTGRRMRYPGSGVNEYFTVVGVVPTIRLQDLSGGGNQNGVYYLPWSQNPGQRLSLAWSGRADSVAAVQREFARLAPGATLFEVRSMSGRVESTLAARRAARTLASIFAGVAVLLTAIGLNGLLAFVVSQQRREIGIRMAIGSRPSEVLRLFLRDGAGLTVLGLVAGVCAVAALRPLIANQLYGVAPLEPAVLIIATAVVAVVSLFAIAMPACRASRVDPARVLREG